MAAGWFLFLSVIFFLRASLTAQLVQNSPAMQETRLIPGSGRYSGEGIGYPLQYSWVSLVAQLVKNPSAMQETQFNPWVGKIPWRREQLPIPVFWPGEFHGLYSPWGHKKLDMTEWLSLHKHQLSLNLQQVNKKLLPHICGAIFFSLGLLFSQLCGHQ